MIQNNFVGTTNWITGESLAGDKNEVIATIKNEWNQNDIVEVRQGGKILFKGKLKELN